MINIDFLKIYCVEYETTTNASEPQPKAMKADAVTFFVLTEFVKCDSRVRIVWREREALY